MIPRKDSIALAALLAAGCASAPPVGNPALDDARATYRLAAGDPQVQLRAPVELVAAVRFFRSTKRSGTAPEIRTFL